MSQLCPLKKENYYDYYYDYFNMHTYTDINREVGVSR